MQKLRNPLIVVTGVASLGVIGSLMNSCQVDIANEGSQHIIVTGHIVDCTGGPCSPMAH